jgi:transcriptional regulator with XRE-family HTH domain
MEPDYDADFLAFMAYLKARRIELHLTQAQVAKALGLGGQTTVANWESPRCKDIPWRTLIKYLDLLRLEHVVQPHPSDVLHWLDGERAELAAETKRKAE